MERILILLSSVLAFDLREIIDQVTASAMNVVEGLILLSFMVGLGLYVVPYVENLQAYGKTIMTRSAIAQVVFSLSTVLFQWLASLGG